MLVDDNFVLVCPTLEPLANPKQEVSSREHLLVGQKVQLAVVLLPRDSQPEVPLGRAY